MTHVVDSRIGLHDLEAGPLAEPLPPDAEWRMQEMPDARTEAAPRDAASLAPAGFQQLIVGVLPSAYGYALRLTRNRADAEDLLQEAALRAVHGEHTFQPGSNFKAWFFRILVRSFWQRHREQERRPSTVDFDDTPDLYLYARSAESGLPYEGEDPAGTLFDRLGTERVADAIAQLPEEYGVVCTLYFMEDFAYHEIASVLELPVGTVRSRLHRGRKMLQKTLWRAAVDAGIVTGLSSEEERP
ncbi:MAG TPA: sigma-70 family RNA polymerase sigma factor [Gemmatimonadaceae bacterium]|nr:sigma-70 family RNA polymerase sigma factor [Gemmatimonadaceae bacterium]